eukprot:895713-Amphidinium_carterae.1
MVQHDFASTSSLTVSNHQVMLGVNNMALIIGQWSSQVETTSVEEQMSSVAHPSISNLKPSWTS